MRVLIKIKYIGNNSLLAQNPMQRKPILIDPSFLIQLSNNVQILNHFYEQQSLGSLSAEYRSVLTSTFTTLNQNLQMYETAHDAGCMVQASIIKCRAQLEVYCLEKLAYLVGRESEDLGALITKAIGYYRANVRDFQRVVLAERRKRVEQAEAGRDAMVDKLKEELQFRKDYIAELKARLEDVEAENSKMYQKLIGNAKSVTDRVLSLSPKKSLSLNNSLSKLKSEALLGTAHKTLSAKQVEQTILDIMETKQKQQALKGKRVNLKTFLKTYFRYKFGMKDLADETQLNFREAISFFSHSQQKNIFILFTKILDEQCDQKYFTQQRIFLQKLLRVMKRYLNQKQGIAIDQLQRIYDQKIIDERLDIRLSEKDVQYILINTYKTSQVDSLHLILNQILIPKLQHEANEQGSADQLMVPSKRLINEILNYELSRYLLRIEDTVRAIREIDNDRGYLNQEDLETVIARLQIPQDKIEQNMGYLGGFQDRFLTHSETIEIVQKIRRTKPKKK